MDIKPLKIFEACSSLRLYRRVNLMKTAFGGWSPLQDAETEYIQVLGSQALQVQLLESLEGMTGFDVMIVQQILQKKFENEMNLMNFQASSTTAEEIGLQT